MRCWAGDPVQPSTQRSPCQEPREPPLHLTPCCGISSKQVKKKEGDFTGSGRWRTLGHCVRPLTVKQETSCNPGGCFWCVGRTPEGSSCTSAEITLVSAFSVWLLLCLRRVWLQDTSVQVQISTFTGRPGVRVVVTCQKRRKNTIPST